MPASRRALLASALATAFATRATALAAERTSVPLSFAVLGDTPYTPAQVGPFVRMIGAINADSSVRFVVHVGDIKSGAQVCTNTHLAGRLALLQRFAKPVIFTPGDNDWTDCHERANGRFHPHERPSLLRRVFYSNPERSLGQRPMRVVSQRTSPGYERFVENVRFDVDGLTCCTLHIVGSDDGLASWSDIDPADSAVRPRTDRLAEVIARRAAALDWLDKTFDHARRRAADGVAIFMHANPRFGRRPTSPRRAGYNAFIDRLRQHASAFERPVLLAHGDLHWHFVDRPLADARNLTRMQVPGSPFVGWVKVGFSAGAQRAFDFESA